LVTDEQNQQLAATVPICKTSASCEIGWSVARRWVLENADLKIEQYSPDYIATYQAYNANPYVFAARVSKEPIARSGTRRVGEVWCGAETHTLSTLRAEQCHEATRFQPASQSGNRAG
jgi:hypothetical protein